MPMPATDDLNDHLLEGDDDFDDEEEEEEEDKNDNSVVIEQDEYGRILFEKNKVDGALRHQLQFPSKSGANETFESLDYDKCENALYRNRFIHISHSGLAEIKKFTLKYNTYRWILCGAIGCVTALVAVFVDFCTRLIMSNKFGVVSDHIKNCSEEFDGVRNFRCLFYPWWFLVLVNLACTLGAALLCLFISPAAAGGGIAEIKCFLNGVRRKDWLSFKTAFVKVLGVILAVGASLPVGKEGPMVHAGAIIGSGLPQGKSSRLGFNFNTLMFRNDRAKRDYVSVGVAAGVAAGFGAPIGGVLLSLEEGASFWNQGLTWRTLFTCMCTLVVLQLMMSGTIDKDEPGGGWGHLSSGGLADFGVFGKCGDEQLWFIQDLIVFAVMGCAGGLIGAMWNGINTRLVRFRLKYTGTTTRKLIEAGIICIINTTVMFMGGMYLGSCQNLEELDQESILGGATVRQFFCREDQFNDMATISLSPLDKVIKQLFHRQGNFSLTTCFSFFAFTWILSCWTCGVAVPSGLFIPLLACGGAFGRFVGELCRTYLYHSVDTGTYALVGAAAILGGIVRMTISLTVILVETTNEVSLGLPILITLMLAKWCGDYFNEGIYDIHIKVKKIPLLGWEAEDEMKRYTVDDVMSKPVVCIQPVCRVSDIVHLLKTSAHNGFPVVDTFVHGVTFGGQNQGEDADTSCPVLGGKFIGLILRSQLITMLQDKCYGERIGDQTTQPQMTFNDFASRYPQRRKVEEIYIPPGINTLFMDVTPYMNPSPYTVQSGTPLPRVFNLYRTMGLRHIVVLDDLHYVVGMITRNELTEARIHDFNKEFEKMDKRI